MDGMSMMDCRIAVALEELRRAGARVSQILDVLARMSPPTPDEVAHADKHFPVGDLWQEGFSQPLARPLVVHRSRGVGPTHTTMAAWLMLHPPGTQAERERLLAGGPGPEHLVGGYPEPKDLAWADSWASGAY